MRKSVRLFISGSLQPLFFHQFIKEEAEKLGIRGFTHTKEDGVVEVFIEGDTNSVQQMILICRRGNQHSLIRNVEEKDERYQGFKDFKILKI